VLVARKATAGDASAVHSIRMAAAEDLTVRYGHGHWSTVMAVAGLRDKAREGSLYVVEQEASPVATFMLTDKKIGFYRVEWFAEAKVRAGYLLHLVVHPSIQRRGIGRYAIGQAETLSQSSGLQALRFDAYQGEVGASPFYLKCGYKLVHWGEFNGVSLDYFEKTFTGVLQNSRDSQRRPEGP
jgi:GNAT superfamily N-acetyltransferase